MLSAQSFNIIAIENEEGYSDWLIIQIGFPKFWMYVEGFFVKRDIRLFWFFTVFTLLSQR